MRLSFNMQRRKTRFVAFLSVTLYLLALTACSNAPAAKTPSAGGALKVVVAENFWASIVSQMGGEHVTVTALINSPDADPHDYEPTAQDARSVADAQYVVWNGGGYEPWMEKLIEANPVDRRTALNIGELLGLHEGDNPHFWYSPDYVLAVAQKVHDDLKMLDSKNAAAYDGRHERFLSEGLQEYSGLIQEIKTKHSGAKVGATESIFLYLAPSLGLEVITPPSYLEAVSEGQEVSAADQGTVTRQIEERQIKLFVYNSQNAPNNVRDLLSKAEAKGIPVVSITETLTPPTASFQEWQVTQLKAIKDALGTGAKG